MVKSDIITLLEYMNSQHLIRLNKIIGSYYSLACPFHNDGNERKPSAGVLLEDQYRAGQKYNAGWFHCFACSTAKSLVDWVSDVLKNHNISSTTVEFLSEHIPGFSIESEFEHLIPSNIVKTFNDKYMIDYIDRAKHGEIQYITEEELAKYRYIVPYMYERKLTNEIIEKFDVGYDGNYVPPGRKRPIPCITFPVRDENGNTLFICRRSIKGKLFFMPEDIQKPVYGLDCIPSGTSSILICESIINALTATSWGYPSVALFGTGTPYQINQLRRLNIHEFVICTDGDEAGHRAVKKLKRNLKDVAIIWTIDMPDGKDINDLTKEEFDKLYANRS